MTVKEFVDKNRDILIQPLDGDEFQTLTDGRVLFCITASAGNKPIGDRDVRGVGYHLVVATSKDNSGNVYGISTACLTKGGYVKCDYTNKVDIGSNGNKVFYHCTPLSPNDPRSNNRWLWN